MADFEPQFFDFESADTFIDAILGTLNPERIPPLMLEVTSDDVLDGSMMAPLAPQSYELNNYAFTDSFQSVDPSTVQNFASRTLVLTGLNVLPMSHTELLLLANTLPGAPLVKDEMYRSPELEADLPVKPKSTTNKIAKPKKDKTSHNMIEKKYRTNINLKIVALRDAVPALRIAAGSKDVTVADLEGLTPAQKLNKASVLTKATEYIKHLENKNQILKQQNLALQRLIQQADLRGQQQMAPPVMVPVTDMTQPQAPHGFGFYPDQQMYQQQPQTLMYMQAPPPQQPQVYQAQPSNPMFTNKMLLAGMATIAGAQMFGDSGNGDYKGMSGAPFLAYAFSLPKSFAWTALKLVVLGMAVYLLVAPLFAPQPKKTARLENHENLDFSLAKQWTLVHLGVRLPKPLSSSKLCEIMAVLSGRSNLSESQFYKALVRYYFLLLMSETLFENCLLLLVIGRLLIKRFPAWSAVLSTNLSLKGQMILHLEYRGRNPHVQKLATLIHKIDGLAMLGLQLFLTRLTNLALRRPLNAGINQGMNQMKYVEYFQEVAGDYFAILTNWRVLELINDLNFKFLEAIVDVNDRDELLKDILADVATLDKLITLLSLLQKYFDLFKAVVNLATAPALADKMQARVSKNLLVFKQIVEGPELTDDEAWSDDEEELIPPPKIKVPNRHRLLIASLGLVLTEEFIVLVLLLVVYHVKNDDINQALRLLNYLKLDSVSDLTMLLFTAVSLMVMEVVPQLNDVENLDLAVKLTREWLNLGLLDASLQQALSKAIVRKGMILNGVDIDTDNE